MLAASLPNPVLLEHVSFGRSLTDTRYVTYPRPESPRCVVQPWEHVVFEP